MGQFQTKINDENLEKAEEDLLKFSGLPLEAFRRENVSYNS
jgi:hypothetical protein